MYFPARRWLMAAALVAPAQLGAQNAPSGGTPAGGQPAAPTAPAAPPASAPPSAAPALNFSGIIFGSYNVQRPTTPAPLPNQNDNAFVVDRAYLNFRMAAGDRTSIRITTDVYQSNEATSGGFSNNAYSLRAKYAYLQYDAAKLASGAQWLARVGIVQNSVVEHQDAFWPRYLSQVAVERHGYFSSADVGLTGQLTLPRKLGELSASVLNGPGYTTRERDRFKDILTRLSLTPLSGSAVGPILQSLTITGWGYKGATASSFVNGGTGQVGAVGEALDRSRYGLFVGVRDPRLVIAGELAQRHEEGEAGANTPAAPRRATETTGRLLSGFSVVRPLAFVNASGKSRFGLVGRYDRVTPTTRTAGLTSPPSTENGYHTLIAGLLWDLSQKAQLALDYQETLATNNGVSVSPAGQSKGYYAHFSVSF